MTSINIDFRLPYPNCGLSNLAPHPFVFRGHKVAGMEGLLVACKFSDINEQLHCITLSGFDAMRYGRKQQWYDDQRLHWNGESMERLGSAYQQWLDEAYNALYTQNSDAKAALLETGNANLSHTVGRNNPTETILTVDEFCSRLLYHRHLLQTKNLLDYD